MTQKNKRVTMAIKTVSRKVEEIKVINEVGDVGRFHFDSEGDLWMEVNGEDMWFHDEDLADFVEAIRAMIDGAKN